jgi:FixJ family two-component response regulator
LLASTGSIVSALKERFWSSLVHKARVVQFEMNHDIAERLVITEGTVEVHVKHILSKLGFRSCTQVAGWVARQVASVSDEEARRLMQDVPE